MENNYERLNKAALIEKLLKLDQEALAAAPKLEEYDSLKLKYDILKGAREEDKGAVDAAHKTVDQYQLREQQMVETFREQMRQMQQTIGEQSQTVATLFEMMDNSISQQIFYYKKFKAIFISQDSPREENQQK